MASIDISHEHLHVHLKLYEKVLAWQGSVAVPLLHITDAHAGADIPSGVGRDAGFRGTYIPGHHVEGTQTLPDGHKCFIDVRDPKKALTIELDHDLYSCLVVQVESDEGPEHTAERIMTAVREARARAGAAAPH